MRCPACGAEGAYVGLSTVECRSRTCRHAVETEGVLDGVLDGGDLHVVGGPTSYAKIIAHIKGLLKQVPVGGWKTPVFAEGPADASKLPGYYRLGP